MKTPILFTILALAYFACEPRSNAPQSEPPPANDQTTAGTASQQSGETVAVSDGPKTVREFFMLLPEDYFFMEGCDKKTDKDCRRAKLDYLKTYLEIDDVKNGYLKAGCDGAQACIEMTIFKRPDATYLVAVATMLEMFDDYYFLDHKDGKWTDVSKTVVPQYDKGNIYELPRYGTTVKVYKKKVVEKGDDYEVTERGQKLYELEWKDGRFTVKR